MPFDNAPDSIVLSPDERVWRHQHSRAFTHFRPSQTPETITPLMLVTRAHGLICQRHLWRKGKLSDREGRLCSLGALYVAGTRLGVPRDDPRFLDTLAALTRCPPTYGLEALEGVIWRTNDYDGYLAVRIMFVECIDRLRVCRW